MQRKTKETSLNARESVIIKHFNTVLKIDEQKLKSGLFLNFLLPAYKQKRCKY